MKAWGRASLRASEQDKSPTSRMMYSSVLIYPLTSSAWLSHTAWLLRSY